MNAPTTNAPRVYPRELLERVASLAGASGLRELQAAVADALVPTQAADPVDASLALGVLCRLAHEVRDALEEVDPAGLTNDQLAEGGGQNWRANLWSNLGFAVETAELFIALAEHLRPQTKPEAPAQEGTER